MIPRILIALALGAVVAAAQDPLESAKRSVVGVSARRTMTFNFQGREMSRPVAVRQLGIVIGKGLVLTPTLGDDPENVRVHLPRETDAVPAEVVDSDARFTVLRAEDVETPALAFADGPWQPVVGEKLIWVGLLAAPDGRWIPVAKASEVHALLDIDQSGPSVVYSDPPFSGPVLTVGAPLFDARGRAVGLVVPEAAAEAPGGGRRRGMARAGPGLPLVRPVAQFAHYLGGNIKPRGVLGVSVEPLTEKVAEALGMKGAVGLLVTQVTPGSGADAAGIAAQQVITRVGETSTPSLAALQQALRAAKAGDIVAVEVLKLTQEGAVPEVRKVKLGARDPDDGERLRARRFGFVAEPIPSAVRRDQGLAAELKGLHVRRVTPGTPAALARPTALRRGDIILRVGETDVADLEGLRTALQRQRDGTAVTFFIRNGAATRFVEITPEATED